MLAELYIENIAVIEKAEIRFSSHFNVLTGETGAGKSIVIDAINTILGERISREIIRTGTKGALVSAVFQDIDASTSERLRRLGYEEEEDGSLLIQRELREDGRGGCKINGRPATVSVLRELGNGLINIHGQHESYELLSPDLHVRYVDGMGGLSELLGQYRESYGALKKIRSELEKLTMDESQKSRRIDLLRYQIDELTAAQLRVGEQEELTQKRTMYQNSEKIASGLQEVRGILDGEEGTPGAVSQLETAASVLQEIQRYLSVLGPVSERVQNTIYDLQDCSEELRSAASQLEYDPEELARIETRLDEIYRLSLKYGETEESMLHFLAESEEELKTIQMSEETVRRLSEEYEGAKQKAISLARELSHRRREVAEQFTARVKEELRFLNMPGVEFLVQQERCPLYDLGCDRVQFLISTNPGEPPKPIAKIASGGELSRIMLAIKTVLADCDEIGTLIFDEVDTGVSGSAARKVGLKLREVARTRQVICVTHLAQIASLAENHLLIQKNVRDGKTYTEVLPLSFEGRTAEIARIMGGGEPTALMLRNAEEMLKSSQEE